jgi:DNA-binding beta-propeller fold protein YncE
MRALSATLCACLLSAVSLAASPKAAPAHSELMYLGVWPHTIDVVDSSQEKIVDKISLPTDIARTLVLSADKKTLYGSTVRDNHIVTIDLATRKVTNDFPLNTDTVNYRTTGFAVDPTGQYLYTLATPITKKIDHYEVDTPKFLTVDLAAKKIVRTVDYPKDEPPFVSYRTTMKVSPDGKLLYLFRDTIQVFNTSDFKLAKKIELSKPTDPSSENLSLSLVDDPNDAPGMLTGIFQTSDPYVHREVFGIASIDLSKQSFDMTPIGPANSSLQPLMMSPDHKLGYTVSVSGTHGDRVTEFWVFDMKTRKILDKRTFVGRTRLNFAMTADGTKLMIYNAGFQIEFYDAKTMALHSTLDLEGDTTSNLIVMPEKD